MEEPEDIIFFTIDLLLATLIVSSNISVLWVIFGKSHVKNSKNLLLISLAVADLCIGVFVIPNVMYMRNTNTRWKGFLCRFCLYLEYASNAASVFTLAALALDRFRAVLWPLKSRVNRTVILSAMLFIIWGSALTYGLRGPLIYEEKVSSIVIENVTYPKYSCFIPPSLMEVHKRMVIVDFVVVFSVPSLILIICNISIMVKLSKKSAVLSQTNSIAKKRRKPVRLLLVMMIIFVVCHFPLYYYRMSKSVFKRKIPNQKTLSHIFLIISFVNSFLNVFFYGALNVEINAFLRKLARRTCCERFFKTSQVHPESGASLQTTQQSQTTKIKKIQINNTSDETDDLNTVQETESIDRQTSRNLVPFTATSNTI